MAAEKTQQDKFEKYLVEEFYDDYREGMISRRTFIRRVAFITGSMAAAASAMLLVGCQPIEIPAANEPIPTAETPAATAQVAATSATTSTTTAGAVPGAKSPLSVPEGDPDLKTGDVNFDSQGTQISGYLAQPVADGTYRAVLVCHENRGLTPHIRDVARRFAKEGYVALAVDLLSREGGTPKIDADQAPGLLTQAGIARHVGDFAAAYDYLQGQSFVEKDRIGMNGFCFGGGVTWQTATQLPLKAAVPFYGPAPDLADVPKIKAAVFGVYAELDKRITGGMEALKQALDAAGVVNQMKVYPGVNHAFHNDTGQNYNEEQAVQAWKDMLAWFDQYI
jgi:carboxymethylenebutenolidase